MDLAFQVPVQYCYLQHQTLFPSPVVPTTECCFCFDSASSFFLGLFLYSYWAPTNLRSSSFNVISFCLFILFLGFSRQEYWSGLPFPSPVDHVLSELSIMTCPSWVALRGMAHSFIVRQGCGPSNKFDEFSVIMVFILSVLWRIRISGLWKLLDGRECLWEKLDLVLMCKTMLSKSLICFSLGGQCCVPSLLFDLRPNYGGVNVNNGDLLQKVPCTHGHSQCPQPCSRPPPTHASTGDSWPYSQASVGSLLWGHCSFLLGASAHKVLFDLWVSPVDMRFDSKHHFAPPATLLWLSFAFGHGVSFFGGMQHSPLDGCSEASCNFGVIAGEDERISLNSAILVEVLSLLLFM